MVQRKAKPFTKNIDNIVPDLEGNLERDLNIFVRTVITYLSTKQNSPVDTGFFASSWTVGRTRPRPKDKREDFNPWKNIKATRKASGSYNTATGAYTTSDTTYSIKAPVEFVISTEDDGRERREAKVYITPDLIGDNQPDFQDEVTLTYAGSTRVGQIVNIDTRQGGQTYLFTLLVRF